MNASVKKIPPLAELPHDSEAEKSILGALIRYPEHIRIVSGLISPDYFYLPPHRFIFQELVELSVKGDPIDEIMLSDGLRGKGLLKSAGDFAYITELREIWSLRSHTAEYCKLVKEHYLTRELIAIAADISQKSRSPSKNDVSELVAEFQDKLSELTQQNDAELYLHIKDVFAERVEQLYKISENPSDITGLESGFIELDKITSGLQKSDLIIVAARPSMGKTAFAANIAGYSAVHQNKNVLMFSLEMSRYQIADRLLSSEGMIDSSVLRTGKLEGGDWEAAAKCIDKISSSNIYINDKSAVSIMEISQISHQLNQTLQKQTGSGLDIIIIDYLQLIKAGSGPQNREQEISQISRMLKSIAKELNVSVVALSQLNRAVEARKDKRPMMSDIRESGSIEQDADIILFIYRDEVYDKETKDKGIAEIIISKHRNGQTGVFKLNFIGKYAKFTNSSERDNPYEF